MSKKILSKRYPKAQINKVYFKPYNYRIVHNETTYYIKTLPVTRHTILSINSSIIWEIRKGRQNTSHFKTSKIDRYNISQFTKLQNKIVVFIEQPYKILRYINESEVEDISTIKEIQSIKIYRNFNEVLL